MQKRKLKISEKENASRPALIVSLAKACPPISLI